MPRASGEILIHRSSDLVPRSLRSVPVGMALGGRGMGAEAGERCVPWGEYGSRRAFFVLPRLPG
jgi:hypothetical protein